MARRRKTTELADYFTQAGALTRAELADALGVTRAYVDQIARGDRTPRLGHALAISDLTGVSVADLCRAEDRV